MNYAYFRVSTDKQTTENQRFEILKFADEKKIKIDSWLEETVSGTMKITDRKLGELINQLNKGDRQIVTELSRLGRSLLEVMSILHTLMEKNVQVYTTKERYELGNNISSKVLTFAFSLSAEIERSMISSRTREALARGAKLGRPKGSLSKQTKLTGREEDIKELLKSQVSDSAIVRIMKVNRVTLTKFINSRGLRGSA
jgi:putative DNA-invertase from lambdoid prophage Rac